MKINGRTRGTYELIKDAYEQGRADVIEELLTTKKYDELSQKIALDVFDRGLKKGRADAIDEVIALYEDMRSTLATHVSEFVDRLEQLK